MSDLLTRTWRGLRAFVGLILLSILILAARCSNYPDVFFGGNVYFADADCYARMTRVRMCAEHPGLSIRHHNFENYSDGTSPHTTVPVDYLICPRADPGPFTTHALDLAGALFSPICGLLGGWFLWWWSRRAKLRYRWILLILYAISPILVHGTELGRPDHQSLLLTLFIVAICAEWSWALTKSQSWSALAWVLSIWVSAYEPLILFVFFLFSSLCFQGGTILRIPTKSFLDLFWRRDCAGLTRGTPTSFLSVFRTVGGAAAKLDASE